MTTLIENVWAGGRYWGPDHGNADDVPAELIGEIPADAWSAPLVSDRTPDLAHMSPEQLEAEADRILAEADGDQPPPGDEPEVLAGDLLAELADTPHTKADLLAFAEAHDLDVNKSHGAGILRATLAGQLEATS